MGIVVEVAHDNDVGILIGIIDGVYDMAHLLSHEHTKFPCS